MLSQWIKKLKSHRLVFNTLSAWVTRENKAQARMGGGLSDLKLDSDFERSEMLLLLSAAGENSAEWPFQSINDGQFCPADVTKVQRRHMNNERNIYHFKPPNWAVVTSQVEWSSGLVECPTVAKLESSGALQEYKHVLISKAPHYTHWLHQAQGKQIVHCDVLCNHVAWPFSMLFQFYVSSMLQR